MLDVSIRADILNLLGSLARDRGIAVVMITHDLSTVAAYADRIAVMYLGRIVEYGPTREVLANPQHPYAQALLSVVPIPDPAMRRRPSSSAARPRIPRGSRPAAASILAVRSPSTDARRSTRRSSRSGLTTRRPACSSRPDGLGQEPAHPDRDDQRPPPIVGTATRGAREIGTMPARPRRSRLRPCRASPASAAATDWATVGGAAPTARSPAITTPRTTTTSAPKRPAPIVAVHRPRSALLRRAGERGPGGDRGGDEERRRHASVAVGGGRRRTSRTSRSGRRASRAPQPRSAVGSSPPGPPAGRPRRGGR